MLVSHSHRFVFLKTRKSASTSVEMLLEPFCRDDGGPVTEATPQRISDAGIVGSRLTGRRKGDRFFNHLSAVRIAERIGPETFDAYARIATVRNPFAVALSLFGFMAGTRYPSTKAGFLLHRAWFRRWVAARSHRPYFGDNAIVRREGRLIVDHFVRFEHLEADLAALGATLGIEIDTSALPATKRSKGRRDRFAIAEFYDEATADAVRTRYAWAFERIGYSTRPEDAAAPPPFPRHPVRGAGSGETVPPENGMNPFLGATIGAVGLQHHEVIQ
ncbi:MAG: hypothetical protein ACPGID_03575 [Rubricella sp.]